MINLSLYDFDRTIYNGDSGLDILFYLIKNKAKTRLFIPEILFKTCAFGINLLSAVNYKESLYRMLSVFSHEEWSVLSKKFWDIYSVRFFPEVVEQIIKDKQDGYTVGILSATAEVILAPVPEYLSVDFLIGTVFGRSDKNMSSRIIGKNCKKEEKVLRLFEHMKQFFPDELYSIKKMYSDSLHDKALFDLAEKQFTVEANGSIRPGLPNANSNF